MSAERHGGVRMAIAKLAAEIIVGEDVKQYFTAKRLAAKRLLGRGGARSQRYRPSDLPSNGEIRAALLEHAIETEGDTRTRRLFAMRIVALEAMTALEPFTPRLIGSVATGHVRRGSDIDLHVFAPDALDVVAHVQSLGWAYEVQRVSIMKRGVPCEFTHVLVEDVFTVELTVYAPNELRHRRWRRFSLLRRTTDERGITRVAAARRLCIPPFFRVRSDDTRARERRAATEGGPVLETTRTRSRRATFPIASGAASAAMILALACGCSSGELADTDAGATDGAPGDAARDGGAPSDAARDGGAPICADGISGAYVGAFELGSQTGAFEVVFDATPATAPLEAAVALAGGSGTTLGWADLAAIVRFGPDGNVDARDGSVYAAAAPFAYVAGATYRIRMLVDVPTHTYDVLITAPGGSEVLLADDHAFRSEQAGVASLDQWGVLSDSGVLGVCFVALTPRAPIPPVDNGYPFQGYTATRGAFESPLDGGDAPRVLVVDRLTASGSDGDEASGRGSLPWALSRSYPRVILFEVGGVIDVGGTIVVRSPYVSVHGQSAPSPGITLYHVEFLVHTHDVVLQHLRVRMGEPEIGGGDSLGVCGAVGDTVHDIIIDHCSTSLAHDEQLSISSCGDGDVRRVTISNNLIGLGLNYDGHAFGTLVDSGGSNAHDVDEILLDRNLWTQVSYRTPLVNHAARRVTITNNTSYDTLWHGLQVESAQYPEGQLVDYLHNLYWRGPETETPGTWPRDEVASWPAEPDLWASELGARRPVSAFVGPAGSTTRVYFEGNYDYLNADDYTFGAHEGRPVHLADQRYQDVIAATDITAPSRVTTIDVELLTPIEIEAHVANGVGARPRDRDALDALAVGDAQARRGGYINWVSDLTVAPVSPGTATRALGTLAGYPAGHELDDGDSDGLSDVEEWVYGL